MKFAIITHVPHIAAQNQYFAYAPYVREMNVWAKQVTELIIVAPISLFEKSEIDVSYTNSNIKFVPIDAFDVATFKGIMRAILKTPKISWQIYKAMRSADHIHLRCPGNIGLLGCFVQILFPAKTKTAKYAGNWDPKSKQPFSYKLQKWILSNTFLTRNMKVLVYGEWEGSTSTIKPFFTATYAETDKKPVIIKDLKRTIDFVFVGALVVGKNPLYAIKLVEKLAQKGFYVKLTVFGEGIERDKLERYVALNDLAEIVFFKGNQNQEIIKIAFQESHFVVLPSKSEGWPKVIAEGMFWGCVPIATKVSCVPFMLEFGKRGILVEMNIESDSTLIENVLIDQNLYNNMQTNGAIWSRKYTMDFFESEIKKMML